MENRHRRSKHNKVAKDSRKNIKAIVSAIVSVSFGVSFGVSFSAIFSAIDLATPNSYQSVAINEFQAGLGG